MKKLTKLVLICIIAVLPIVMMVSCALSEEDVAGVYYGSYTENGSSFSVKITLTERGTYGRVITKDNLPYSSVAGRYEIRDEQIILYTSSDYTSYTEYHYSDGQLEHGGHVFRFSGEELNPDNNPPSMLPPATFPSTDTTK